MTMVDTAWTLEEAIADGATFLPLDEPSQSEALLEHVAAGTERRFEACCARLLEVAPALCAAAGFQDSVACIRNLPLARKRWLATDPLFLIWLQRIAETSIAQRDLFRARLADLRRIAERAATAHPAPPSRVIPHTAIEVVRYDLDPLIAEHTPRMYDFSADIRGAGQDQDGVYPLAFFVDVAAVAIERIRRTWPPAYEALNRFVKLVMHLPNAPFKSASTERYPGIVFVTARDNTLLDLEESFLHECAHHILYKVMECDRLVFSTFGDAFKLPWSGLERDLDGYFHAFYVYICLAAYLERVRGHSEDERRRARAKLARILRGLLAAAAELEALDRYTAAGRGLLTNLKREVEDLAARHRDLLDEPGYEREPPISQEETVRRLAVEVQRVRGATG